MPAVNTYSPLAVANWFIDRAEEDGIRLDPMKLIKLVYLAHGWHLAVRGESLIDENVEAWPYGPVVPSVYHAFKRFGAQRITGYALDVTPHGVEKPSVVRGDTETTDVLERVWNLYGDFSGLELSTLTHQPGSPWEITREQATREGKERGVDIPDDLIRQHFARVAKDHGGAY